MIAILKDRWLAKRLGEAGRQTIEDSFSWGAIAASHVAFYERLLAGSSRGP